MIFCGALSPNLALMAGIRLMLNLLNFQVLQLDVLEEGQSKDPLADASNNQLR